MERKYAETKSGLDPMQLEQMRADMQQRVRTHYQSRMVAVTIPISQAAFVGFLAGLLVGGGIWFFGGQLKYIVAGFFFTFVVVTGIVWVLLTLNWNSLVWNVESQLGIDLTGDGVAGNPTPKKIQGEVSRNGGANKTYVEFPDNARLAGFFRAIQAGSDISQDRWTPIANGFSKPEYWSIIGELIRAGVLHWRNEDVHTQGVDVTDEADEILDQWIEELGQ